MTPAWLHGPDTDCGLSGTEVAIAIEAVDASQMHVGVVYRNGERMEKLHLAWHFRMRNDTYRPGSVWVTPNIPPLRGPAIAAKCRQIWKTHEGTGRVPYGFRFDSTTFSASDGRLELAPGTTGLTCATFVLAVFRSIGVEILAIEAWKGRSEDASWQKLMLDTLKQHGASHEHTTALATEIGAARYRPEEVAGGAAGSSLPCSFEEAVQNAAKVTSMVRSCSSSESD